MAAPAKCSISAKAKAASDKATVKALDAAQQTGQSAVLSQMSNYAQYQTKQQSAAPPLQKLVTPPPPKITKKHDLINYYLSQGLVGQQVVDAMATKGFKVKVADVNANIKWYGSEKIPANFPKADLEAAKAKAAKAIKEAEDLLKMQQGAPSAAASKDVTHATAGLEAAPVVVNDPVAKVEAILGKKVYNASAINLAATAKNVGLTVDEFKTVWLKAGGSLEFAQPYIKQYYPEAINVVEAVAAPPVKPYPKAGTPEYSQMLLEQGHTTQDLINAGLPVPNAQFNAAFDKFVEQQAAKTYDLATAPALDELEKKLVDLAKLHDPLASSMFDIKNPQWLVNKAQALGATPEQAYDLLFKSGNPDMTNAFAYQVIEEEYGASAAQALLNAPAAPAVSSLDIKASKFLEEAVAQQGYGTGATSVAGLDPDWVATTAKSMGASYEEAVDLAHKANSAGVMTPHQVDLAVNTVYGKSGVIDVAGLTANLKKFTGAAFTDLKNVQPSFIIKNAQAMHLTEAEAIALTEQTTFWDENKALHIQYAVKKQYGTLPAGQETWDAFLQANSTAAVNLSPGSHFSPPAANGLGTKVYINNLIEQGFTQDVIENAVAANYKHLSVADAKAWVKQEMDKAVAAKFTTMTKQITPFAGGDIVTYAKQMFTQGFTPEQVIKQLKLQYPSWTGEHVINDAHGIWLVQNKAMSAAVPASQAAAEVAPGKVKVIKDYKDKKHDLIYKLRMAGYKGYEVVDEMAKFGYKIKLADVNANIKYYNTPKIPASKHVFSQIATPQVTAAGTMKPGVPVSAPTPQAKLEVGEVPFEKAEAVMVKRIGEAQGSNPGGLFENADGKKWYVKQYTNVLQAKNEYAANEIYRRLGVKVPTSKVLQAADGKLYIATSYVENTQTLAKAGLTKEKAEAILDSFAADVLTANWDAVGLELDNIIYGADGVALRVDQGGSLLFRAKGGLKDQNALRNTIGEWESFANPSVNPAYRKVFEAAGITSAEEITSIVQQLKSVESAWGAVGNDWRHFLKVNAPQLPASDIEQLGSILNARTKLLLAKRDAIEKARKQAEALKNLMKQTFNTTNLKYQELGKAAASAVNAATPPGAIAFQTNPFAHEWAVITQAPQVVLDAGYEGLTHWYIKYFPDLKPNNLVQLLNAYYQKFPGKIHGVIPQPEHITNLIRKEVGVPDEVIPMRAGFAEDASAHKNLHPDARRFEQMLTTEEHKAIRSYTGSSNGINGALRENRLSGSGYEKQANALDNAMRKSSVPSNVIVWRGVGGSSELLGLSPQDFMRLVGARIEDLGYGSFSVKKGVAKNFAGGNVLIRAHLPKGTKGVYVQETGLSAHTSEYELILPRGTQFTVTRVSYDGHYYIVDTEIAAQPVAGFIAPSATAQARSTMELIKEFETNTGLDINELAGQPINIIQEHLAEAGLSWNKAEVEAVSAMVNNTSATTTVAPAASDWVAKAPFKSMDTLLEEMAKAVGFSNVHTLKEAIKLPGWKKKMTEKAKSLGWSQVQWNTVKKNLLNDGGA